MREIIERAKERGWHTFLDDVLAGTALAIMLVMLVWCAAPFV